MKEMSDKEVRQTSLEILKAVDYFCKKKNIRYSLTYGTLLGAVRHKGYIPWDDDIDIMMLRPEYERFLNEFSSKEMPYKINAYELDSAFPYPFAKVSDERTIVKEKIANAYSMGVNIDVFPIDFLPQDEKVLRNVYIKQEILRRFLNAKLLTDLSSRSLGKKVELLVGNFILLLFKRSYLVKKIISNATKYQKAQVSLCGDIVGGYGIKEKMDISNFDNYIDIQFEGYTFKAIEGYFTYLSNIYGNFMQLPPKEKRVSHHHFEAYYK